MSIIEDESIEQQIVYLLVKNPGLHLSKIAEILNINISEIEENLNILRQQKILYIINDDGVYRYYVKKRKAKARERRKTEFQKKIIDIVLKNPGIHLSKIAESLNISVQLADYHLSLLQKDEKIRIIKDEKGYFKRYYLKEKQINIDEKKIIDAIRKKTPLRIVLLILKKPGIQHKDIMKELNIPSSTLSYHITRLEEEGIIVTHPYGREKGYKLFDEKEIIRILKKYEFSIEISSALEGFIDIWNDFKFHDSLS